METLLFHISAVYRYSWLQATPIPSSKWEQFSFSLDGSLWQVFIDTHIFPSHFGHSYKAALSPPSYLSLIVLKMFHFHSCWNSPVRNCPDSKKSFTSESLNSSQNHDWNFRAAAPSHLQRVINQNKTMIQTHQNFRGFENWSKISPDFEIPLPLSLTQT